jgi:phosphoribosylformylglycinamidine synthase
MLSTLKDVIPGCASWPRFVRNRSKQFEARVCMVQVMETNSLFLKDMQGSRLPVAVAHGEGRVEGGGDGCLRYVDGRGHVADQEAYPLNPNGSLGGLTGFSSDDGRVLIMMPHPERVVRLIANTWQHPRNSVGEDGPWMQLFYNARKWVN